MRAIDGQGPLTDPGMHFRQLGRQAHRTNGRTLRGHP
jgi:hypothetical protein